MGLGANLYVSNMPYGDGEVAAPDTDLESLHHTGDVTTRSRMEHTLRPRNETTQGLVVYALTRQGWGVVDPSKPAELELLC